jgi:hypothetical protein
MVPVVGARVGTGRVVVVGACSQVGVSVVVVGVAVVGARVGTARIVVVGACSQVGVSVVVVGVIVAVVAVPLEGLGLGGKVSCEVVGNDVGISVNWIGGLGVDAITQ